MLYFLNVNFTVPFYLFTGNCILDAYEKQLVFHTIEYVLSLTLLHACYIFNFPDEQGWEIIPKGAASLLVQPFNCRILSDENITNSGGFVFLISRVPQAYGDKERAWVAALANKFKNIRHTRSE